MIKTTYICKRYRKLLQKTNLLYNDVVIYNNQTTPKQQLNNKQKCLILLKISLWKSI